MKRVRLWEATFAVCFLAVAVSSPLVAFVVVLLVGHRSQWVLVLVFGCAETAVAITAGLLAIDPVARWIERGTHEPPR